MFSKIRSLYNTALEQYSIGIYKDCQAQDVGVREIRLAYMYFDNQLRGTSESQKRMRFVISG